MGGAAGHMAHPFDCREVRNGQDLVKFYVKAVNAIPLYDEKTKGSSVSVKLDGVNASFRLQKADNPAGFMFVLDRGGKTPGPVTGIDFDGVTSDNVLARVKGNESHGLIQVVNHMTKLLNHDLMKLRPYVEALGLFDRMGPEGVFFDAEYYANEDEERGYQPIKNNVNYSKNYIAIHRLSEFYTETKETRTGKIAKRRLSRGFYWETVAEINELLRQKDQLFSQRQDTSEVDQLIAQKNNELKIKKQEHQKVLDNLAKAVQEHASDLDMGFDVYTKIGLRFKEGLTREVVLRRIENALDMKVPYNYLKINDKESIGPTAINEQTGEVEPRTLKQLLLSVDKNPAHVAFYPDTPGFTKDGESVKGRIQTKSEYKKDPKQSAFALQIYEDIMVTGNETGIGPFDIGNSPRDAEAINSAVILWHAVRHIGNAIKESIVTDVDLGVEGGDKEHEGIVIQSANICDGIAFKFTGEFIVDNRAGGFGVTPKGEDIPSDSSEALHEGKLKYGRLIESFMPEPINLSEQEEKQYVILIPGGFKPPTGGHYDLIKQYDKNSNIRKIFVVAGAKERGGVTLQHSKDIFAIYGGFSDKVEFITSDDPTPLTTCYELMKNENFVNNFPGALFSIGAGDKGGDPARIKQFAEYFAKNPNLSSAKIATHPPAKAFMIDGEAASASRLRKAYAEEDWETFKKLLPNESHYDDVVQVLNGQNGEPVNENFLLAVPQSFWLRVKKEIAAKTEYLINKEKVKPDQAYAIANSMDDRGELEEDLVTEERFKEALRPLLSNLVSEIPEFGKPLQNIEVKKDVIETLATALSKQLEDLVAEKTGQLIDNATARKKEAEELGELEEMSSMAGGNVQGYAKNAFIGEEDDEQKDQLLQEFKLRRLIRKAIRLKQKKEKVDEQKLRKLVRNLVTEGDVDADTKPAPYTSTALSALADAFNQVLPVLKTGLRKLAKSEERQSYRAHVLQKFSNMFKNFEGLDGNRSGAIGESDINEQEEDNDITIKIDDPDRVMPSDGKENERFKPEEKPTLEPDDDDIEKLAISTENPTGARFAFNTINTSNIEKLLSDTRRLLPQEEDKQEFKEYAMYNVDLWLLTYEQELADELGVDPAFDEVVTKRPAGAQIQGAADKFAAVEEPAMEDFEEENTDDITTDLESILMME